MSTDPSVGRACHLSYETQSYNRFCLNESDVTLSWLGIFSDNRPDTNVPEIFRTFVSSAEQLDNFIRIMFDA